MSSGLWIKGWKFVNTRLTRLSMRLVRWTGKSTEYIHPKHLLNMPGYHWYLAHLEAGDGALDVGCGNGLHTLKTAGRCRRVVGFDLDRRHLALARRLAHREGADNADFCLSSAEQPFPFRAASFDKVLLLDVLEHLDHRDEALTEIGRVLKDDGQLILSVPNKGTSWKKKQKNAGLFYYSDPDHRVEYTEPELSAELHRNGFTIREISPIVYDTPWIGFIDLAGGLWLGAYRWLTQRRIKGALANPQESSGFRMVCSKESREVVG